ncbi:amino acid adenylation domain-containing protein [Kitasatospora sp. NPDC096147]|uniref:amino acid adenylation domain-containing protein n=1 Tax=Kitasatospora sp. NPDC096147 TaxID=3364093 RepID=UPI003804D0FF
MPDPSSVEPAPSTWIDVLRRAAHRSPDAPAFTHLADDDETAPAVLSYAELDRRARAIAVRLRAEGLSGGRALLLYPSGPEYVAAFFGCLYAGVVAVPAYPPTRQPASVQRLVTIVMDSGSSVALTTSALAARIAERTPSLTLMPHIATDLVEPDLAEEWQHPEADAETVAFLQYTSGSTADPRGVVLTHRNLIANSEVISAQFGTDATTTVVSWLPMYHDMGLIGSVLGTVYCGGHCVTMSPVSFVRDPYRWLEAISRYRGTASGSPNFGYEICVDRITPEQRAQLDLSSWRVAFNGAEPIRDSTLRRFAEAFAGSGFPATALSPCYGLAESSLMVSGKPVGSVYRADERAAVSSGPPAAGQRVEIVDPETRELRPAGEVGEIWVSGPSVSSGYWNRPELNETTFGATLAGTEGPRFLRTGDLGRLTDGELFVTGRLKDLIIIRGRNHYPQDVEHTSECADPALGRQGAAAFAVTADGAEELVVVQEVHREARGADLAAAADRIRADIARVHELRPLSVVLIKPGSLPKTSSGKVRRSGTRDALAAGELAVLFRSDLRGCPETDGRAAAAAESGSAQPAAGAGAADLGLVADGAVLEEVLAEVAELLEVPVAEVLPDRPLVELGMDSISGVRLAHRLRERLRVELDPEDVLAMSAAELAAAPVGAAPAAPAAPATGPGGEVGDHILTAGQRSLWFGERFDPDSPAQVISVNAAVSGALDVAALRAAATALVAGQASLRTSFPVVDGEAVQRVHPDGAPQFEHTEVAGLDDAAVEELLRAAAAEPFDILTGPLFRIRVLTRSAEQHWIHLAVHHLVADLWSMEVVLRELERLYRAAAGGRALPAPAVVRSGLAHAAAQEEALTGAAGERLFTFWQQQVAGAPTTLALPADRPRQAHRRPSGARHAVRLDETLTAGIKALARDHGVTLHDVLLAAYQLVLSRASGSSEVLVGTPTHGRSAGRDAETVGYFVNMLPVRGSFRPEQTFSEVLRVTRDTTAAVLRHADMPFATLVERLRPARVPGVPRLVQAVFALQQFGGGPKRQLARFALGLADGAVDFAGLRLTTVQRPDLVPLFDLTLTMGEVADGLAGTFDYDADLFDAATVARLAGQLTDLLAVAVEHPGLSLAALHRPHTESVLTGPELPGPLRPAHEQFAEQAAQAPGRTALSWDGGRLSYGELDSRAEELAARLVEAGVVPEQLVGLCLDRSPEWAVAVLAVFKAGGAYVPLDPGYPADRLDHILRDSGVRVVVTRGELGAALPPHTATVLDLAESAPPAGPVELPEPSLDRLAYVIYTSGSTGRPKGVEMEHRGLASVLGAVSLFDVDDRDAWVLFHSVSFDYSVWELWAPLTTGGTLVVVPPEAVHDPKKLWELVREHRVTVLTQTPAVFAHLTAGGREWLAGSRLRHVMFGGEKLEAAHLADWVAHGDPRTRLANLYGITETAVHSTFFQITDPTGRISLGGPLPGTEIRLLDEDGEPVPAGGVGEMHVGGSGLARGYLGRPGLTSERFVPHPTRAGERLYRSGDLARATADGRLEYLGRSDHQVKIRGHRIETGEVEAAIEEHPQVRRAVVLGRPDSAGQLRLVAYLVAADGIGTVDTRSVLALLRDRLPGYAVPSFLVTADALPLTPNGKVDRAALPEPSVDQAVRGLGGEYAEPVGEDEQWLARLVGELLELPRIGRHDDLLALGGHSLMVARLALRVRDRYGVELPLRELFGGEITVSRVAALIGELAAAGTPAQAAPAAPVTRVDRSAYTGTRTADGRLRLPEAMRRPAGGPKASGPDADVPKSADPA